MLKDSGERREFQTGAVRDIVSGKGRCDLMPLGEVSVLLSCFDDMNVSSIIADIDLFLYTGDALHIYEAISIFIEDIMHVDYKTAILEVAKQYEDGAIKYGEHNWEKGLSWSSVLASAFRHFEALRSGEDYDESGCLHAANLMANIAFIIEYYKSHPELDDRPKIWNSSHDKIGLDLDGVIFDFESAYEKKFNIKMTPYWAASYQMKEHLKILEGDKDFWVNLPVLHKQIILLVPLLYLHLTTYLLFLA